MRFVYSAVLEQIEEEVVVTFRDLPECLTSGGDVAEALEEAQDALEEAIAGRIDDGEPIPMPSEPLPGEHPVVLSTDMAAKAALVLAFRESGLSQVAFATKLGKDEKAVRRMLDARHGTAATRINKALRHLGKELIVELVEHLSIGPISITSRSTSFDWSSSLASPRSEHELAFRLTENRTRTRRRENWRDRQRVNNKSRRFLGMRIQRPS